MVRIDLVWSPPLSVQSRIKQCPLFVPYQKRNKRGREISGVEKKEPNAQGKDSLSLLVTPHLSVGPEPLARRISPSTTFMLSLSGASQPPSGLPSKREVQP